MYARVHVTTSDPKEVKAMFFFYKEEHSKDSKAHSPAGNRSCKSEENEKERTGEKGERETGLRNDYTQYYTKGGKASE